MGLETLFDSLDSWTKVLFVINSGFLSEGIAGSAISVRSQQLKSFKKFETGLRGELSVKPSRKKHINTTSGQNLTPAEIFFVKIFFGLYMP